MLKLVPGFLFSVCLYSFLSFPFPVFSLLFLDLMFIRKYEEKCTRKNFARSQSLGRNDEIDPMEWACLFRFCIPLGQRNSSVLLVEH